MYFNWCGNIDYGHIGQEHLGDIPEDNLLLSYIIPTVIFTSWHIALTFANGISYHGGVMALVGGAGFMGAIWGLVLYKTRNIKIVIIAHICANLCAFSQLICHNFS